LHRRIDGVSPKVSELLSVLEEITGSVIIWCAYREEIAMVAEALRKRYGDKDVVEIHGGVEEDDRHRNVYELFQTRISRFLVGNAATGGMGLKMSAAETVIYYSNTFNYTDRVQSEDRTQSSDQTKKVLYIDLLCEDTVDELILEALDNKQDVSEFVRKSIHEVNHRLSLGA
jgi:SNF2 family DNA or RNA helicase